jgi:hypothetical protein
MKHTDITHFANGIPLYFCTVVPCRETRSLRFVCPHCKRVHAHGLPYGDPLPTIDRPTPRGHHCFTDAGRQAHGQVGCYYLAVET